MSSKAATKTAAKKRTDRSDRKAPIKDGAYADHKLNRELSAEQKLALYTQMVRIRRFEERANRAYQQGKIGGFLHLYIGQEACAVGTVSVMDENDHVITAYRDHGHAIAVGMETNALMAELYGKATGSSRGKGGSMHFFAPDKRFWGGHGIVGGQVPLGLGIAFALKYREIDGCCLCFMGDGATGQGPVYESLNLAALWNIPAVFIIENNGYSMGTSQSRHAVGDLAKRAEGFDIKWDQCKGHDLYEVRVHTREAIDYARQNSRPVLLEIDTYRYRGHSVSDPDQTYRTKDEIKEYQQTKDPINLFQQQLIEEGHLDEERAKEIDRAARLEADQAAQFADESDFPDPKEIMEDIYWETDQPADQRTNKGRFFFETGA